MKILILADVESKYLWDYFDKSKLEGVDLILSCGDLNPQYLSFLASLRSHRCFTSEEIMMTAMNRHRRRAVSALRIRFIRIRGCGLWDLAVQSVIKRYQPVYTTTDAASCQPYVAPVKM